MPHLANTSAGGLLPLRSYHQNGIAGRSDVAGNSNRMIELAGKLSKSCPVVFATTEIGSRRPQAAKGTVN